MVSGKIKLKPANNKAIWAYIIIALIFYGAGIACFILLFNMPVPNGSGDFGDVFASWSIESYWWIILLGVIGVVGFGLFIGWVLLKLVSKFGHILVYAGVVLYIIGAIGGVITGAVFGGADGALYGLAGLAPAVFLILGLFTNRKRFQRAGAFMKFTGDVVLAEKGMILAPLFVSFISILNILTMGSIFAVLVSFFYTTGLAWLGYVLGSVITLIQLVVYYGIFYAAEAINTTYAYEWYRKRDPDMKFCRKNVAGNFSAIFTFGVLTALVGWIQRMLRNSAARAKGKGQIALAVFAKIFSAILGTVFKYLTYFTLPAIAVEGKKFKEGITRSFSLLKRYYMDVLIRETGVKGAMSILQWITFLMYGIVGALTGVILRFTVFDVNANPWTIAMLVSLLPALLFAFIPTFFIFRPMKTAYLTFIFAYAQDEESNHKLKTRMPKELRDGLKEAKKEMDTERSIANLVG